jgi:chaperonin GroES
MVLPLSIPEIAWRIGTDRSLEPTKGAKPMTVRPLHDRILIKRIEEKETVKGGIIIPDTAKEKPQEGQVIAVGHGKKTEDGKVIPLDVKAGDRILFGKYSGTEIKIDEQEYLILREDEVLGVLEAAKSAAGKK